MSPIQNQNFSPIQNQKFNDDNKGLTTFNLELIRIEAQNLIRNLDVILKKLEEPEISYDEIAFLAPTEVSTLTPLLSKPLLEFEKVNSNLRRINSVFKPNDPIILQTKLEQKSLGDLIKKQLISYYKESKNSS